MQYRLFKGKAISALVCEDLQELQSVGEGWFVEYKVKLPSPKAVAKSVAAFANHFGGWLFYGIEEGQDQAGNSTAGAFHGFPADDTSRIMDQIRDSVASHVNPAPAFEMRAIQGGDGGPFPSDQSVIVVRILEGQEPPYVHSSGRIYRRVGSKSDPKEENDRGVLDQLWEKGRRKASKLRRFIDENVEGVSAGSDKPFLHVVMLSRALSSERSGYEIKFQEFAELMNSGAPETGGLSMENAYTEEQSLIARLVGTNDPTWSLPLWRYFPGGTSIFSSPIASFSPHYDDQRYVAASRKYKWLKHFADLAQRSSDADLRMLDLNHLLLTLGSALGKQSALLEADNKTGETDVALIVDDIMKMVPFFDAKQYLAYADLYGLPVQLRHQMRVPNDYGVRASFVRVDLCRGKDDEETKDRVLSAAGTLWARLLQAMGVPAGIFRSSPEELGEAMARARGAITL